MGSFQSLRISISDSSIVLEEYGLGGSLKLKSVSRQLEIQAVRKRSEIDIRLGGQHLQGKHCLRELDLDNSELDSPGPGKLGWNIAAEDKLEQDTSGPGSLVSADFASLADILNASCLRDS